MVAALAELPDDLDPAVRRDAEAHLVEQATVFNPARLRVLGRKVLEVVAPDVHDDHERRRLEADDARAESVTSLTTRSHGDGTTEIWVRVADAIAQRLLTYLHAFTSPRQDPTGTDRRPHPQRLGHAFGSFLEAADPARLPLHGGDATTLIVTIDFDSLRDDLGPALVGDLPISAAEARRLACTAGLLPAVLDGDSHVLDLGRSRRLFSPAQRKAMAVRDTTCRARGCDIPASWCEAHHLTPWSRGGRTDLADGVLLCSWHHHRAHDPRHAVEHHRGGDVTFARRT